MDANKEAVVEAQAAPQAQAAPAQKPFRPGKKRKKVCNFCAEKTDVIDFKDAIKLRKYVSERSKILPNHRYLRKASERVDNRDQARKTYCSSAVYQRLIKSTCRNLFRGDAALFFISRMLGTTEQLKPPDG